MHSVDFVLLTVDVYSNFLFLPFSKLSVINGFLHFLFLDFHRKIPMDMYPYQIIDFSFQGKSRLFFIYFLDSTLFAK